METTDALNLEKYILTPEEKKDYERLINQYGQKVLPAVKYDVPENYNIDKAPEYDRSLLKATIEIYRDYLNSPIISDELNHDERRRLRKRLQRKLTAEKGEEVASRFSQFLGENKMKRNKITDLIGSTDMLKDFGLLPDQLADNLLALAHSTDPYNPINNLKQAAYDPNSPYFNDPDLQNFLQKVKNKEIDKPILIDPWEGPTTPEKMEKVNQISNAVVDILDYLGKS